MVVLGSLPSVVYRIDATPLPAGLSVADSVTWTGPPYQPGAHPPPSETPLQLMALVGRVVSGGGRSSYSPKSSMVTEPVFWSPIPAERLVAPEGTAGVVQVACVQEPLLVNVGDCVQ